ncbi:DUF6497 family protein [Psychromarinibacter sp. S121]|uniref:DUF6497 family protein n=1 Tax=Psychromarinibacter sp. S121 TaxID=3415127 RepID=UPI003C7E4670
MRLSAIAFWALAGPVAAEPVEVPSGQPVEFAEVIRDAKGPKGLTWRFRFVAPDIGHAEGKITFAQAASDMEFLCRSYAVPRLPNLGPRPSQVVISLSDKPSEFGVANPEITQFFEAYSIEGDRCIWEAF